MSEPNNKVVEIQHDYKTLPCSCCGKPVVVRKATIMTFCGKCSAGIGVKK